ncbi:hypothetical protein WwAna1007 [Wolbachia endosymbiont of Drosophila ananassae]|nr:hypothetical protein WwAna1007 [Wolbachia endosymbiont of Drosophila ananassae]
MVKNAIEICGLAHDLEQNPWHFAYMSEYSDNLLLLV